MYRYIQNKSSFSYYYFQHFISKNNSTLAEKVIDNSKIHFKSTATSLNKVITLKSNAQENIGEIIQTENTITRLCNLDDSACPGIIFY